MAAALRGHWAIEDRFHWVSELDWDEDRSQVRTASGPRVMATLRNLAVTILRMGEAAPCYHSRRPDRPLQTLMST